MWIIGVILGVVLLLSLPLLVPVSLVFSSKRNAETKQTRVSLKWLYGLIHFRLIPGRREKEDKPEKDRRSPRILFIALRSGFSQKLFEFAKDLLRIVHIGCLRINLRLGLADPADTGMLAGVIMPVMALCLPPYPIELSIEPDFCLEGLDTEIDGELQVYPVALIMPVAKLIFSASTLSLVRAVVRGEK